MAVYKEAMKIINTLKSMQKQIYNDAVDYGIPVLSVKNDKSVKLAKSLIDQYFSLENGDTRIEEKYGAGVSVTTKLNMIDEFDGCKFVVTLNYCSVYNRRQNVHPSSLVGYFIGILSIDSARW